VATRCAVLGSPIGHSLSPVLHRAAYAELGLEDWTYDGVVVDAAGLGDFLDGLDTGWRGLSLTMPLKRVVVPLVDTLDTWTRLSGVANTVLLGDERRLAFNTDIPGAMAALVERTSQPLRSAVVLGGGATATSTLLALVELGCTDARVLVRDPSRAEETLAVVRAHPRAPEVSAAPLDELQALQADVVVSTIPAEAQTPRLLAACASIPVVFDVVYDPWPTPFARAAQDSGRDLVAGLDLLAQQAVLQVQLMTGRSVPADLLRAAGRDELERRAVQNAPRHA
jgi:shikimate dehydrogenase